MPEFLLPKFLLTKEEIIRAADSSPGWWGTPDEKRLNLVAQAALKKVAIWMDVKAAHHNGLPRFNREEWEAFKREAGLAEKEAPDA